MMNFTLDEIKALLKMREHPQHMREDVRVLTQQKLDVIERQISELNVLHQELQLLIGSCCSNVQVVPSSRISMEQWNNINCSVTV